MSNDSHQPRDSKHEYQRRALAHLEQHVSMSLRDLAEAVLAEDGVRVSEASAERIEEIQRALERRHLPELEERSYIRYDEQRQVASLLGRGVDVGVDATTGPEAVVELEPPERDTVSVALSESTIEHLHDAMRHGEDLDPRMSYDEVVRHLAEDG